MKDYFALKNKFIELNNIVKSRDDICTPMDCVELMVNYIPNELWFRENLKFLDPCCGYGNFPAYLKTKVSSDFIYCNELSFERYNKCKELLNLKNITNQDFFEFKNKETFDLIIANPPYSGGGNKNRSISNEFIKHSLSLLKDKGYLCFITPNNWMSYNNNNTTLKALLDNGSFLVIDNDVKKYFKGVGSSFTVFVWQKGVFNHKTFVKNNYIIKDEQFVSIPKDIKFLPLYLSNDILSIFKKCLSLDRNTFNYRCDLHRTTQKSKISDTKELNFVYETIHTPSKTCYSTFKQDIYDKYLVIIPLSTYFKPYIKHNVNVTQSVGYVAFDTEQEAKDFKNILDLDYVKVIVNLTRYGNFNNIMVLKHLKFDKNIYFTNDEIYILNEIVKNLKH